MKKFVLLIFVFSFFQSFAQRDTREILGAQNIHSIDIITDEVFKIEIIVGSNPGIRIKTHSEGEYYNEIFLDTQILNQTLEITTRYPEILSGGYDKLSAHKVFSLEIVLEIPEGLVVSVTSNIASLITNGSFNSISANLKQGYCQLKDFTGSAVVNTYAGNIQVQTNYGQIAAHSRNGETDLALIPWGENTIELNTVDGNILVHKN